MLSRRARFLLVLVLAATPLQAEPVTLYRCIGEDGELALRDTPCRPGERQRTIEMQRPRDPPPQPEPPPAATAPETTPARPTPRPRVVVARPPRPLYECITPDGEVYTSDTGEGDPRWVPLWTLGYPVVIDRGTSLGSRIGAPAPEPPRSRPRVPRNPPTEGALYASGTWVRDECHPLPQGEVCARLRERDGDLRREYNSALQSERRRITRQRRGLQARLEDDCARR